MTKRKRCGALLLCICMAFVLFASSACIALGAGHECSAGHCPVCRRIMVSRDLLRALGLAFLLPALFLPARQRMIRQAKERISPFISGSPVSRKVRLND